MSSSSTSLVLFSGNVNADQTGIQAYNFDESSGELRLLEAFTGYVKPSYILPHPNGKWLYAVSETSQKDDGVPGSVLAISIERDPFNLKLINRQPTGDHWPCHLRFDRTGKWLFVSNYHSGSVGVWPIMPDGSLGERSDSLTWSGKGPNHARQESAHAHSSILSPDNHFAIIADLGSDLLVVQQFDETLGKFKPHTNVKARPGAGPRHMIFHPNGRRLYVSNELDNTVSSYAYDGLAGNLSEISVLSTLPSGAPENIVADIHLSRDARHLFVSNRGHNSLAVFEVDGDGGLSRLGIYNCGGNWPRNFAISPGGRFILVANQYSNEVCCLPLSEDTGEIGVPVARVTVPDATCVQFVPLPG